MRLIIIILTICLFCACKKNKIEQENHQDKSYTNVDKVITMNSISDYDSLTLIVSKKGDTIAFKELYFYLMDTNESGRTDSLMKYSKLMVEKYNYKEAYVIYLKSFSEKYNINFDGVNYNLISLTNSNLEVNMEAKEWLKKMLNDKVITQKQFESIKNN